MENLNSLMRKTKVQIINMLDNVSKKYENLKEELKQTEDDLNVLKDYNIELISTNEDLNKKLKKQNLQIIEYKDVNNNLNKYKDKYENLKKENYTLYGFIIFILLFDIFIQIF